MTTMLMEQLKTGDVLEIKTSDNDVITVLVLLATDDALVLDPCNDDTPFVINTEELVEYRKFDAESMFADDCASAGTRTGSHRSSEAIPLLASGRIPLAWAPWTTRRPRCFSESAAYRSSNDWSTRSTTECAPTPCCSRCTPDSRT